MGEESRNYVDTLGAFFLLDKRGKLLALRSVLISDDCSVFQPRAIATDLTPLYPLVASIKPSSIVLAINYGPAPSVHYLIQVNMGGARQTLKAPGKTLEILSNALDSDSFPIIALADLERAVHEGRKTGRALHIPLRTMVLRPSVPQSLVARIKDVFLHNARSGRHKAASLGDELLGLRAAIRDSLLDEFLTRCMWLDKESSRLGSMVKDGDALRFVNLDTDDPDLRGFLVALEKDPYGDYLLDFREFARIIPRISKSTPWVGPTLHVYNESYRRETGLEEYYSLYNGFRALTQHGAPVILLEGQDPRSDPSEVRYLQVTHRSVNVLQGRLLGGDALKEGVRDVTSRDLVWKT